MARDGSFMCPLGSAEVVTVQSNTNAGTSMREFSDVTPLNQLSFMLIKGNYLDGLFEGERGLPELRLPCSSDLIFWPQGLRTCSARSHEWKQIPYNKPHLLFTPWACVAEAKTHVRLCGFTSHSPHQVLCPSGFDQRQNQQETGTHTGTCASVPQQNPQETSKQKGAAQNRDKTTGSQVTRGSVPSPPVTPPTERGFLRYNGTRNL